jgi:hypothetical protein
MDADAQEIVELRALLRRWKEDIVEFIVEPGGYIARFDIQTQELFLFPNKSISCPIDDQLTEEEIHEMFKGICAQSTHRWDKATTKWKCKLCRKTRRPQVIGRSRGKRKKKREALSGGR